MHPKQVIQILKEMKSLPEVEVHMWGNGACRNTFESFTKPHPKYRLIQNKKWGVALLPLPDTFQEYLRGKQKQALRTNRKRAIANGFCFEPFKPIERLEEILLINSSVPTRQGREMDPSYLDIERLKITYENKPSIYGVFDNRRVLKAYADTPVCGELFIFSGLLGYADDLGKGIMYLLVSEVIREMITSKAEQGVPRWAMYDTFFGATSGLRFFKKLLGFEPRKVKWVWESKT